MIPKILGVIRKIVAVIWVPLLVLIAGFAAQRLMLISWNAVVGYKSPHLYESMPVTPRRPAVGGRVVLVVVDGLRYDTAMGLPGLARLRERGAGLRLKTGEPSLSLPGWAVIGTGAWQEITGVTTNWYKGRILVDNIFAEARRAGLETAVAGDPGWDALYGPWIGQKRLVRNDDRAVLREALRLLAEKPDLLLVHFSSLDEAGHKSGGASRQYYTTARELDNLIGRLAESLDLRSTTLLITSDHGHRDAGGHGGWEESVVTVPLVALGKGIRPGWTERGKQADIAPTVAALLGTSLPQHSVGQPLYPVLSLSWPDRVALELVVAEQRAAFDSRYVQVLGVSSLPGNAVFPLPARQAFKEGDLRKAEMELQRFDGLREAAVASAREDRLKEDRLRRLPLVGGALILASLYLFILPRHRYTGLAVSGALLYFAIYYAFYFIRGYHFSLSDMNSEEMLAGFFRQRLLESGAALLLSGLVLANRVGRKKDATAHVLGKCAGGMVYVISYLLLIQVLIFAYLYGIRFEWALPDLRLGFKYYLDLLQMYAVGLSAPGAVLTVVVFGKAVWWVTDRKQRRRKRLARGRAGGTV
ncbi:MAG: alkaline phosphatase family protein [Syntrophothermus sp.]